MHSVARILCAIDLEKASERAFDRALSLAVMGDAKLFILHATPAKVRFSSRAGERLQYLTELRQRAEAAGVRVRVEEQHGDPAGIINRRRGWRRLREGSVAERVLRRAAWPILIVPWDAPHMGVLDRKRARTSSRASGTDDRSEASGRGDLSPVETPAEMPYRSAQVPIDMGGCSGLSSATSE
jgi:nucleotide-binding universal stress UspA family protein